MVLHNYSTDCLEDVKKINKPAWGCNMGLPEWKERYVSTGCVQATHRHTQGIWRSPDRSHSCAYAISHICMLLYCSTVF